MSRTLIEAFGRLALYNREANRRLYAACAELSDAERKESRPAFFGSIHATLNHILLGDRIWLTRFEGQTVPSSGLDAILYESFDELAEAREREDARLLGFVEGLTDELLAGSIHYRNNAGALCDDPVDLLVQHLFNHQTHHRGQIHDMLSQTDVPPPSLDMHRLLRP